jgi:hypothetical protein
MKKRKLLIGSTIGTIVLAGVVFGVMIGIASAPSKGTLSVGAIDGQSVAGSFNRSPVLIEGEYASFMYPQALTVLPTTAVSPPVLAEYQYSYKDVESWRLSVTVLQLSQPSLIADNSYQFRTLDPTRYIQTTQNIDGQTYVVMSDTQAGGFSQIAYTLHGTQVAEISLYGDNVPGTHLLESIFRSVLGSWQWN